MAQWKKYGHSPEGLRKWAKAIINRPELRCGYCECVLLAAADEMEKLQARGEAMAKGWEAEDDDVPALMDSAVSDWRESFPKKPDKPEGAQS